MKGVLVDDGYVLKVGDVVQAIHPVYGTTTFWVIRVGKRFVTAESAYKPIHTVRFSLVAGFNFGYVPREKWPQHTYRIYKNVKP